MLDHEELSHLSAVGQGRTLLGGCVVRVENRAKLTLGNLWRIVLIVVVPVAPIVGIVVLAKIGYLWIGPLFLIGPVVYAVMWLARGLKLRPTEYRAVLTDQTFMLVEGDGTTAAPAVARAFPRTTISAAEAKGGHLIVTSAGSPVRLIIDPADAVAMAELLRPR